MDFEREYLIGIGQDSHAFEEKEGKQFMLGGIALPGKALKGNSDGDAVLHAICNAISSALGEGSISVYSDEMCLVKGITDSSKYLEVPLEWMKKRGYCVNNISVTIECKTPKIGPITKEMKEKISSLLTVPVENVGITATSGEGLTAFGKGEGIMVFVSLLLKSIRQ